MIHIGVIGSGGKTKVSDLIKAGAAKHNKNAVIIENNEDWFLEQAVKYQMQPDFVIHKIQDLERYIEDDSGEIKFDILIQTTFDRDVSYYKPLMQMMIKKVKKNGYIIINSDIIGSIHFECEGIYPVTYGFNGKVTVTASSIDDLENLRFSYCLQRSISTINDRLIRPFEKPMTGKGVYDDTKYYLAALTCLLILEINF